jgi:hypothetical protein
VRVAPLIAAVLLALGSVETAWSTPVMPPSIAALARVAPGLDPAVLALALRASACAARHGMLASLALLTVIDYSKPSTEPRLWILDIPRRRLLYQALVAHGRGSGELYATYFSNEAGSQQTSLGLFATGEMYVGEHGLSLRLYGLEPGVNDRAYGRALVMHGADYVSLDFAARNGGRIGRSHGCPALPLELALAVVIEIQGGTPLFAYYPDPGWRESSRLLTVCEPVNVAAPPPATDD